MGQNERDLVRPSALHARLRRAVAAAWAVLLIAGTIVVASPISPASAADYPGQSDIDSARAAVADAASGVGALDTAMVSLETAFYEAQRASLLASEDYAQAEEGKAAADQTLLTANQRADEADKALNAARNNLAVVARDAYRSGGSMEQFSAISSADGFDDVIAKTEVIDRASSEADSQVQTVKAAEIVATTMREYAQDAATNAASAQQAASDALSAAKESQSQAQRAIDQVASARQDAVARLAQMRNTSVALEQQRQDGLAEQRRLEEVAAFRAVQKAEDQSSNASAGTTSTVKPQPRATTTPTTDSQPNQTSAPVQTTAPAPEETSKPVQTTAPEPTKDPAPEPTKDPAPATQAWKSSASAGKTAVAKALTLMGSAYEWGGNGPAYDCSGVTFAAWNAAGYSIPRSSTAQYNGLPRVSSSQMRPGDLIYYGTGRSSSSIYHVAMYIGNGQVAEAATKGTPSRVRSLYLWGVSDMLPTVGRP